MSIYDEIKSDEFKQKMKLWWNNYISKLKEEDIKRKELVSNPDYIKWLENFTIKYSRFYDDSWLYFPEKISKEDNENVRKMHLFYEAIDKYAKDNFIYPIPCEFGGFYKISFSNIGYEIGILCGQGTSFFCNRVNIDNEEDFISFDYIMNNINQGNTAVFKNDLAGLSYMILSLYEKGIPREALMHTFNETMKEIRDKESSVQSKKLTKK